MAHLFKDYFMVSREEILAHLLRTEPALQPGETLTVEDNEAFLTIRCEKIDGSHPQQPDQATTTEMLPLRSESS